MNSHVSRILAMLKDGALPMSYFEIIKHELNEMLKEQEESYQGGWSDGYSDGQEQSEYEHDMEDDE